MVALMLGGCVGGGPGSYFESIGRDSSRKQQAAQQDLAALTVDPVRQQTLAPAGTAQPAPQPSGEIMAGNAPADGSQADVQAGSMASSPGNPTVIGETGNAELLTVIDTTLAPQPAALAPAPLPGVDAAPGSDMQIKAYADPQQQASLRPGSLLGGPSSFAIGSETLPYVDPEEQAAQARIPALYASIDHGQCRSGFGPKPKQMGAKRINPGDPYYIEIRMRQTPLMPVGHTYVAYGRLDAAGEIMDEKLIMLAPFGGYVGAAMASGVPMPGVLTPHPDDCRIRPDLAYRVSLNAQRYEMLLKEIRKAKADKPSYLLFANNCNHFMTRIAGSVGIKPPANIYVPAVRYLHDMIEANEGVKVARW
ncbi:MAG: hypothetical protein KDJ80_09400 [Nitratireductor sp.]|nr:hypothetical protein [Nitratireductor sp.]